MNAVISDTAAEYGNYLFSYACVPLLKPFMRNCNRAIWVVLSRRRGGDNAQLRDERRYRSHAIEQVGKKLRG